jgi:hypothetical protein
MKMMIIACFFASLSAFASECGSDADCPNGYYCKVSWSRDPYCVKKSEKTLSLQQVDDEKFTDDEFVSSGESPQSVERARESAESNAMTSCSSQNIHYLAKRVSPFKDSSYPGNVCNPWHQPGCRVTYIFTSAAKFRCINGGGW